MGHLWSHQHTASGELGPKGHALLADSLQRKDGAFVVWVKAGHEVILGHLCSPVALTLPNCV